VVEQVISYQLTFLCFIFIYALNILTAGVGVAAMLKREGLTNITIVEPSQTHYYQPLWTLVGGGMRKAEESARPMESMIKNNAKWNQNKVVTIDPEKKSLKLSNGSNQNFDFLVVAAGTVMLLFLFLLGVLTS
jgi:sulfide:quinone oxidoreductase